MKSSSPNQAQKNFLYQGLKEILNPKDPFYQLSDKIPWSEIRKEFLGGESFWHSLGNMMTPDN
jgi:hypothetical protein